MNRLSSEEQADYFRLNVPMESGGVALDDVDQMAPLQSITRGYLMANSVYDGIVEAIWASNFYFELDRPLEYCFGSHVGHGAILSRTTSCLALIQAICCRYRGSSFTSCSGTLLGKLEERHCCRSCGFYRLPVKIEVRHPTNLASIFLQFEKSVGRRISGFPNSLSWFGHQQGLDRVFGRPDHLPTFVVQGCECKSKGTKRHNPSTSQGRPHKRVRR